MLVEREGRLVAGVLNGLPFGGERRGAGRVRWNGMVDSKIAFTTGIPLSCPRQRFGQLAPSLDFQGKVEKPARRLLADREAAQWGQ